MNSTKNTTQFPQEIAIPQPLEIHPSVSPLAADLLQRVIEILMVSPDKYEQHNPGHTCGTPCCIVGHMRQLAGTTVCHSDDKIGLNSIQFGRLFCTSEWPEAIYDEWVFGNRAKAQVGVSRIEHFLRTGE